MAWTLQATRLLNLRQGFLDIKQKDRLNARQSFVLLISAAASGGLGALPTVRRGLCVLLFAGLALANGLDAGAQGL